MSRDSKLSVITLTVICVNLVCLFFHINIRRTFVYIVKKGHRKCEHLINQANTINGLVFPNKKTCIKQNLPATQQHYYRTKRPIKLNNTNSTNAVKHILKQTLQENQ